METKSDYSAGDGGIPPARRSRRALEHIYCVGLTDAELEAGPPRPLVRRFGMEMERKLRENDHKGGWQGMTESECWTRLQEEVDELKDAIGYPPDCGCHEAGCPHVGFRPPEHVIRGECADVANFAAFIADNFGGLMESESPPSPNQPYTQARVDALVSAAEDITRVLDDFPCVICGSRGAHRLKAPCGELILALAPFRQEAQ